MIGYDNEVFIMNPKISVIIPAYNAEKTLRRCLDSVFASDFLESMEVILVNDGSKDGTLEVAEEYRKFPNFVLIDQPNGGVARARWAGITASRGEYLGFVDADDYIAPDMMSKMYRRAVETRAEIVVCGVERFNEEGRFPFLKFPAICESGMEALERLVLKTRNGHLVNKIYKREIITEENLKKTEGIRFREDMLLLILSIVNVNKVVYLNEVLYFYFLNPDSVSENINTNIIYDLLKVDKLIISFFSSPDYIAINEIIKLILVKNLMVSLAMLNRQKNTIEAKKIRKLIKNQLTDVSYCFLWKKGNKRFCFDLFLLRIGMYHYFYRIWRCPLLSPFRLWWRKRLLEK